MRLLIATSASLLIAMPALAAPANVPPAPKILTDPAMADQLGRMMGAMTRAVMDMPVGELEAAIENRPVTGADRRRRVRDVAAGGDPAVERRIADGAARSGRQMQAAGQAMMKALPSIMESLDQAEAAVERAVANLPDPTYPKR
jgi:hypothetical protein